MEGFRYRNRNNRIAAFVLVQEQPVRVCRDPAQGQRVAS